MRITKAILLKLANDTVARRSREDRGLLAAYLQGSLLRDAFLLGGTTDIDLFFIYNEDPPVEREIVRITDDIHLDITHYPRKVYRDTRELRLHPWLGPGVYGCKILYDPQHIMDFTQASVRGQFFRPEHVLSRARAQAERARQIWLSFHLEHNEPEPQDIAAYLRAVAHAANAIASLNGPPLTERRLLIDFPARAEAVGRPGLYPGLLGLLGAPAVDGDTLRAWLSGWRTTYEALLPEHAPPRLHPHRLQYYLRAFDAILEGARPLDALWPLLRTWMQAILSPHTDTPQRDAWQAAFTRLGFLGGAFFERIAALDAFLDMVEETLEVWAHEHGA